MRPDWDQYYGEIAVAVSRRGECSRRQVGAVIVRQHTIVATGYNGFPPGSEQNCLTGHCSRSASDAVPGTGYAETGCKAIHAESNAIIRAGRAACRNATIYVTAEPCVLCSSLIQASGIARTVVVSDADIYTCPTCGMVCDVCGCLSEPPLERAILLDLIAEMRARHYEHTFPAVGGHPAVEGVCATCEVDCAYADWPCAHSLMADRAEARLKGLNGDGYE